MQLRPLLALALLLVARPASAEEGFLDKLFGGSGRGTPPNPFASNYPSAPPSAEEIRAVRARRTCATNAASGAARCLRAASRRSEAQASPTTPAASWA